MCPFPSRNLKPVSKFLPSPVLFLLCHQFFSFWENLCQSPQKTTYVISIVLSFCICWQSGRKIGPYQVVICRVWSKRLVGSGKQEGETTWRFIIVGNHHQSKGSDQGRTEYSQDTRGSAPLAGAGILRRDQVAGTGVQGRGLPGGWWTTEALDLPLKVGEEQKYSDVSLFSYFQISCQCFPPDGTTEKLAGRGAQKVWFQGRERVELRK